jgi:maleate isomerase
VIAFHCTANSMQEGRDGEERLLAGMARAGAARATTTATAIRRALAALSARTMVLITPYDQATTDHEAEFLEEGGCRVLSAKGYALSGSDAYCATPSDVWRDRALQARRADADVYFLSCANISVLGVIDELERELDRPVITSNQAVVWDCVSRLGVDATGPGRLFAHALAAAPA